MAERLEDALRAYERAVGPLAGIRHADRRTAFIEQVVESVRRKRYLRHLRDGRHGPNASDPNSSAFDPLKAAVLSHRDGAIDEALWLVFMYVHFGRHRRGRWRYLRDVYGKLGAAERWDWESVSLDATGFAAWMDGNASAIRNEGPGGFGNHRKYESLAHTGEVVASYVQWVGETRSHLDRIVADASGTDPRAAFGALFESMASVHRFGRTARFDYLATASNLGLAEIVPDRAHLEGATGPLKGARLLLGLPPNAARTPAMIDADLVVVDRFIEVGMDVVEDSLCNWQKSPMEFKPFRG